MTLPPLSFLIMFCNDCRQLYYNWGALLIMARLSGLCLVLLLVSACGRYFAGPIMPAAEDRQEAASVVQDDGSITQVHDRLEISLRPMSDDELNRQMATFSQDGANSANPYTFGNWKPIGDSYTPPKYSVFQLTVKNYQYPKVMLDPGNAELLARGAHREFRPINREDILEYYYSLNQAYTGHNSRVFSERSDLLRKSLYPSDEYVFSGQETVGYVVFPVLPPDVLEFEIEIRDIGIRFNYRDEPTEQMDLVYRFEREVFKGYHPPEELVRK